MSETRKKLEDIFVEPKNLDDSVAMLAFNENFILGVIIGYQILGANIVYFGQCLENDDGPWLSINPRITSIKVNPVVFSKISHIFKPMQAITIQGLEEMFRQQMKSGTSRDINFGDIQISPAAEQEHKDRLDENKRAERDAGDEDDSVEDEG